jgi:replicative DNA helicase
VNQDRTALSLIRGGKPSIDIDGIVPPHDLDAEAAVLSACILDPNAYPLVGTFLRPEHFYSEAHRRIFEAIAALAAAMQPIDTTTLGNWLKDRDRLQQVGGMAYITQLLDSTPAISNVETHGRIVHDKWRRRSLAVVLQQRLAITFHQGDDTQGLIEQTIEACHELAMIGIVADNTASALDGMKSAVRALHSDTRPLVLETGFARVDRLLKPELGWLWVLAARTSIGKSAFAMNVALNVSRERPGVRKQAVAVFSLEMTNDQNWYRAIACEGRLDAERMRERKFSQLEWARFHEATRAIGERSLWMDDAPGLNLIELRSKIRRVRNMAERKGATLTLVIVDLFTLMRPVTKPRANQSREEIVAEFSRGLKLIAKQQSVVMLAIAQVNRAVERGTDKRPTLTHLRESGAIEQDADAVTFLYRDDYYNRETDEPNIAEFIVAKQRNGRTGTAKLRWSGRYMRFDNLADGEFEEIGS